MEALPERTDEVNPFPGVEIDHGPSAFSDHPIHNVELFLVWTDPRNAEGPSQQEVGTSVHSELNELARFRDVGNATVSQGEEIMLVTKQSVG